MIIRKTRPEEGKRVNTLFAIAFEQPMENGPGEEPGVTNWGAFEEDTMFSTFAVTDFTQFFDGNQVKMGGIGGVATLPSHRRKGGIRGIFQAALADMYENGYDFSYLYPFSTAYYRKFGYENCVNRSFVSVDLGLLSPRKAETVSVLAELGSDLRGPIRELDLVWEQTYNMAVCHPEKDYGWVVKADPAGKQNFLYVCFDTDRKPLAYTQFRLENQTDGRNLVCSRFCFRNRKGFDGLMNLFKGFSSGGQRHGLSAARMVHGGGLLEYGAQRHGAGCECPQGAGESGLSRLRQGLPGAAGWADPGEQRRF